MDPSTALTELVGVSTQVVEAVVSGPSGSVEASRTSSRTRARELADAGAELLSRAGEIRSGAPVERVQVDLERGSLIAVTDGGRTIVATTVADPTTALVALDLRLLLRRVGDEAT
jgi:predicted regulator of Ras-like GTPase activity (Roadblock/LC7/MglB family)